MNFSAGAFLDTESSTSSSTFATVESSYSLDTSTVRTEVRLTVPDTRSSPGPMSLGTDSPVRALVSKDEFPDTTFPSRGTFSPGRISMVSPTETSSGSTVSFLPSLMTCANSGWMSMRSEMDFLVFPTASFSNHSPTWKNSMTAAASGNIMIANAPRVAMAIRKFSSRKLPLPMFLAAFSRTSYPTMRYAAPKTARSTHSDTPMR